MTKSISYFFLATLLCAGCSGNAKKDQDSESEQGEVSTEEILSSPPKADEAYKIGVLFPMLASPFWVNEAYGVMSEAESLGLEIVWYSADGYTNVEKQNAQIENLISLGVDGILIAPTSFVGNSPAIERAIQEGIEVVVHVTGSSAKGITASILADDVEIGSKQAAFLQRNLDESASIIMLSGPAGADWSSNRAKGFRTYIEQNTEFSIVAERQGEPDRSTSQRLTEELLIAFPEVDAIYTAADGMAIGVATVLTNSGGEANPLLTTASFSRETVPYIQDGRININVDESPLMQGRTAIRTLVYSLNGYEVPETIFVPTPEITKENVEEMSANSHWAPEGYSPK